MVIVGKSGSVRCWFDKWRAVVPK